MSHYQQRLEDDLSRIRAATERLAEQVLHALDDAVKALLSGDHALGAQTVLGDNVINRTSREVDRLCHAFIARHLPSAGHLRLMSSTIRVNVALERIGDYAVTISRESIQLKQPPSARLAKSVERLAAQSRQLLEQAVAAFNEGNEDLAQAQVPVADRVEDYMDDMYADMFDSASLKEPRALVAIFVVFSQLKRIADQAKNICDQTLFAVTGHGKPPKTYKILVLDENNDRFGPLAEAIVRKVYPETALCHSAGRDPAGALDEDLVEFMHRYGLDADGIAPQPLEPALSNLSDYHLIISLQGPIRQFVDRLPFHTCALEWELESGAPEAVYRVLTARFEQLIHTLVGDDAG